MKARKFIVRNAAAYSVLIGTKYEYIWSLRLFWWRWASEKIEVLADLAEKEEWLYYAGEYTRTKIEAEVMACEFKVVCKNISYQLVIGDGQQKSNCKVCISKSYLAEAYNVAAGKNEAPIVCRPREWRTCNIRTRFS